MKVDAVDQKAIRVLIVEDHQMVGQLMERVLEEEPDIRVAGRVTTIADAHDRLASEPVDVVLMDYHLPDGDGITAATRIRSEHGSTRVVIVTGAADDYLLKAALSAGCSGYLRKDEAAESLAVAVRAAHAGSSAVSPDMLSRMFDTLDKKSKLEDGNTLSGREMDVLRLLANGLSNDSIAESLFISVNTVRNHTQNILEKLQAHSKLEAVTKAIKLGLVNVPS